MRKIYILIYAFLLFSCTDSSKKPEISNESVLESSVTPKVKWSLLDSINIVEFNKDIQVGKLSIDVGVYFPSNLDPQFEKVALSRLLGSIRAAKEIYKPTGVQINLLWVKTGALNPKYFSIQANEIPEVPLTEYVNMYEHMRRHPSELTDETRAAFESIVEPHQDNYHTIYLIVLEDVFLTFLEVNEGRNWIIKSVRTGGLSFPTYTYCNTIASPYRGVISITNLSRPDRYRSTIAHEIGHKAMNVSHEYKETNPGHEIFSDAGLMLYGQGEEIPSGKEGRWHLERLHLSPFVYRLNEDNTKTWNPDFEEGGHYYDPIYGDKVIHFQGIPPIDVDW